MTRRLRPVELRRSYLFLPGADEAALLAAPASGADVLIQELEDFTPPDRLPEARALAPAMMRRWREAGAVAAIRVNPLDRGGRDDLEAAMRARPDAILLPKVAAPEQIVELDAAMERLERDLGTPESATEIVPNIESARGLVRTGEIAAASARVRACLVASEDMAADLGAERGPDAIELAYVRQRFLVECVAAGVIAIDCPFTFSGHAELAAETRFARRLGYRAKSCVAPAHAAIVNRLLTPSADEIDRARRIVAAFESARARGGDRALVDGIQVEMPTYLGAKRLLARAAELARAT